MVVTKLGCRGEKIGWVFVGWETSQNGFGEDGYLLGTG